MSRLPLVSPLDRVLFLKAQPYLEDLPSSALAALAQYTEEEFFARGQTLYAAGAPPDRIYFLASGGVRTQYATGNWVDMYSPAGIGLIEHLARSKEPPHVWAHGDTLALSVEVGTFMRIVEDDFGLYLSLATQIAQAALDVLAQHGPNRPPESGFVSDRLDETFVNLDLVQRLARARETPFFHGSNLTVMTGLLRFQQSRVVREGDVLFRAGDAVESMALVVDGSFTSGGQHGETHHPAGSMLGAWEILSNQPRRETAQARTPSRVLEIEQALFTDVLEDHFEFAVDYLGKLCRRVVELRSSLDRADS